MGHPATLTVEQLLQQQRGLPPASQPGETSGPEAVLRRRGDAADVEHPAEGWLRRRASDRTDRILSPDVDEIVGPGLQPGQGEKQPSTQASDIVARICQRLTELEWSVNKLAREIGEPESTVKSWVKRGSGISAAQVDRLCTVLDVSYAWLLTGIEPGQLSPQERTFVDLLRALPERQREAMRAILMGLYR